MVMRQLFLAVVVMLSFAGSVSASCNIDFTVSLPRFYQGPPIPASTGVRPENIIPTVGIVLQTQRRFGGWENAGLSLRQANGQYVPLSYGLRWSNGQQLYLYPSVRHRGPLLDVAFMRASLQGVGCAADRQFRVIYTCVVSGAHTVAYGRVYQPTLRTSVLFGGNRVSPRNIAFTANCPSVG